MLTKTGDTVTPMVVSRAVATGYCNLARCVLLGISTKLRRSDEGCDVWPSQRERSGWRCGALLSPDGAAEGDRVRLRATGESITALMA